MLKSFQNGYGLALASMLAGAALCFAFVAIYVATTALPLAQQSILSVIGYGGAIFAAWSFLGAALEWTNIPLEEAYQNQLAEARFERAILDAQLERALRDWDGNHEQPFELKPMAQASRRAADKLGEAIRAYPDPNRVPLVEPTNVVPFKGGVKS